MPNRLANERVHTWVIEYLDPENPHRNPQEVMFAAIYSLCLTGECPGQIPATGQEQPS